MTRLEDVRDGVSIRGITPEGVAKVISVEWYGDQAVKVVYEGGGGGTCHKAQGYEIAHVAR
jgi:hypothetical protein